MEVIYEEDSKSSSTEESDRLEQKDHADKGTGRSYECVFCKRGFTTAQALGGHMNIHRKDKGKASRPNISAPNNSIVSSGADHENYRCLKSYLPFQIYPTSHYPKLAPEIVPVIYQMPFSASTWDLRLQPHTYQGAELSVQYPRHLDLFDEEYRETSLRLQVGPTNHHVDHDHDQGEKRSEVGSTEQGELDLELRLGHYP